jgi:hypothetical protein
MPEGRAARRSSCGAVPEEAAGHRLPWVAMSHEPAARRGERAVHREERALHGEAWAGRREERATHREDRAAPSYACAPSHSLRRAMHDELAGERSAFVAHRSYARTASVRLRRASRRRGRRAREGARKAVRVRSACLPLSRRASGPRTTSRQTGKDARLVRNDVRPLRRDARRERSGSLPSAYSATTRGRRCAERTKAWVARRSASTPGSS